MQALTADVRCFLEAYRTAGTSREQATENLANIEQVLIRGTNINGQPLLEGSIVTLGSIAAAINVYLTELV